MSVTNRQAFPVRVRLTSVGLKTQQLLEYYFRNSGATWYRQVDEQDQADCIAIDLDYPGSIEVIEEYCGLPETLCLVFSFAAYPGKNVINILKPLSLESLDAAAINIAQRLQRFQLSQAATTPAQLNTEKPADATTIDVAQPPLTTPNSAQHDSRLDLADSLLDEQVPEFPASKNPVHGMGKLHTRTHAENLSAAGDGLYSIFQEQHYLSGYLAKALESVDAQRVAFSISLPECNICVLPNEDRVYTSKSLKNAVTIQQIYSELNPGLIKVRYLSKYNRSVVAREIKSTKGFVYALEAFIWRSALLSANGRIPHDADPTEKHQLRHWPNFTRLENTPHCIEIAALWSQAYRSLDEIVAVLNLPSRFVVAFFNGASALKLFDATSLDHS